MPWSARSWRAIFDFHTPHPVRVERSRDTSNCAPRLRSRRTVLSLTSSSQDLLRFITCGSVDDGKSTLIGRLLHDSLQILEDQLVAITSDSRKWGTTGTEVDLALLVDGLQAEREQGITIDVAYRYFDTHRRKYIIADCPGHEQYTRNMA